MDATPDRIRIVRRMDFLRRLSRRSFPYQGTHGAGNLLSTNAGTPAPSDIHCGEASGEDSIKIPAAATATSATAADQESDLASDFDGGGEAKQL
jgi:hypothetical protein